MCSICTLFPWSHWVVQHLLIVFLDFIEHKVPQIMSTDWMLQKMTKLFWVCVSVWNNLWISSFWWDTTLERASIHGSLLSLSWAEMCWTSAHVSSSPVSQGCACTGLHTLCGQLLQHQPVHRPMPSACKDSFDGFHSSLRFLYRHLL